MAPRSLCTRLCPRAPCHWLSRPLPATSPSAAGTRALPSLPVVASAPPSNHQPWATSCVRASFSRTGSYRRARSSCGLLAYPWPCQPFPSWAARQRDQQQQDRLRSCRRKTLAFRPGSLLPERLRRCREQLGREGPSERAVPGEEGGRAVLRDSSRPSTPQAAAPAPSTSRGPGSSPPVSLETLRRSRRQVLRALDSGFRDMARSQRQRDVPQSPGPAPPLPPPSHVGKGIGKRAEGPRVPTASATMGRP
ncbi:uncharacterized protein LOC115351778 [Aquila chrysaetos chrysaetos]|uniref:uncharacterized protein LOC115351778 n=1 Tax=Aquila chrysaetos chrysaetos TaxID=223781 RepID=UPI0011769972|nr:uncharacterized protein LOC115351778 [Aquila chrysaetos chrysaetos]